MRNYPVSGAFELPFRHFEFQRAFGDSAPQTAHAFYCLSEDRASGPSSALARRSLGKGGSQANSPGMSGSRSEWTRAERVREVLEGRRHLGQQVIEAIFISSEPFSAADAESHLRDLVRDVVVLREPAKTGRGGSPNRPRRLRSIAPTLLYDGPSMADVSPANPAADTAASTEPPKNPKNVLPYQWELLQTA